MSQRGSFVTEHMDTCSKCAEIVVEVLTREQSKSLCAVQIPSWEGEHMLPIVAGKIGSTDCEVLDFQFGYEIAELEKRLCHPVRFFCMAERPESSTQFVVGPGAAEVEPPGFPSDRDILALLVAKMHNGRFDASGLELRENILPGYDLMIEGERTMDAWCVRVKLKRAQRG